MDDSRIELRHLRYFLEVAETQNISRAAERLGVSQPSISQQIKGLEEALDTQLFDRLGKRIRLTAAGQAFREPALIVLRRMEEAIQSVRTTEGEVRGHIDVGVIPTLNVPLMPRILEKLVASHPGISLSIHELPVSDVETGLESGAIDVGIGLIVSGSPMLESETLLSDSFAVLAPKSHPLAARKEIAVKELANETLVLLPERFPMRELQNQLLRSAHIRPRVIEIDSSEVILRAVEHLRAVTLAPHILFAGRPELSLVAVELKGKTPRFDIGLLWHRARQRSPAARTFAAVVREVVVGSRKK